MKKKLFKYSLILLSIITIFLVADYYALLGTKTKKILAFSEVRFKAFDEDTEAPIYSLKATCFRHQNHDACTMKDSGKRDVVSVHFPVHKIQTNSWLFTQSEEFIMPANPDIKIMVIHNDYQNVIKDFDMRDIHNNSGQLVTVKMKSIDWSSSE